MHARRSFSPSTVVAAPSHASPAGVSGDGGAAYDARASDTLSWVSPPVAMRPERAFVAFAAVSVTWWVALAAFHGPLVGLICTMAVIGSLTEALFSAHHRVSPAGVFTRCGWQMRQMPWEAVKFASMGSDGIHLSPLRSGARFGRDRGVTLRFANGNNEAVIAAVRRHLKRDAT